MEERIRAVAAAQYGVITRIQLLDLGVSSSAIARLVTSGRLVRLHRGVFRLALAGGDWTTEMAAVLAGGPEAVLSHASAASVMSLGLPRTHHPRPVHVSVPGSGRGRRPGICFHRVEPLRDDERAVINGIPVTSPTRTLVDIAGVLGSREIERAMAVATREGLIADDELCSLPDRYARRPGMALLRALIRDQAARRFTRSEAERKGLDLIRIGRLPLPRTNVPFGPYELDFFWPEERLAVEIDGYAHHSSRARFEGDRRKDIWLRTQGIDVIRLSWRQITNEVTPTAVQLGQALVLARARRAGPGGGPGAGP
jgi:very-short-patch-repair endonuclease